MVFPTFCIHSSDDAIYESDNPNDGDGNVVRVREVSCNNDGALFITVDRQLYAMGSFIGVCTSDQPIKVPQFVNYEILQISMGKQFSVILTRTRSKTMIQHNRHNTMNAAIGTKLRANPMNPINGGDDANNLIDAQSLASTSHSENDLDSLQSHDNGDTISMNSSSSGSTLTIQSSSTTATATATATASVSVTKSVDTTDNGSAMQQPQYSPFINNDYAIERWLNANDQIETQVWCFGSINQVGQLGVGDHVRRTSAVEVISLRDQGVIRICTGE